MIFEQNFDLLTTGCSTSTDFYWQNAAQVQVNDCDGTCTFDSSNIVGSTLRLADDSYTFKFKISTTTSYSIIGIDLTYLSSQPDMKLTLLSDSPITTPATPDYAEYFEAGTLTCSPAVAASPPKLINASIKTIGNIAQSEGTLLIEKMVSTQIIGIRSLRLWVNCVENCDTCASPKFCSICMEGFELHTSGMTTVCEVVEGCPANCQQCYTISGTTTCVICNAGYKLSSGTCVTNLGMDPNCGTDKYLLTDGSCKEFSMHSFYYARVGGALTSFPITNRSKYKCPNHLTLLVLDFYNYKLFRCGCAASMYCKSCSTETTCDACVAGFYTGVDKKSCYSCLDSHCTDCKVDGTGCNSCGSSFDMNMNGVCESNCNASLNCYICGTPTGPCTQCNSGHIKNASGVCEAYDCPGYSWLDTVSNSCVCIDGFVKNAAGNCVEQPIPDCAENQYLDLDTYTCPCITDYMLDANSVCQIIPVCKTNEVLNTATVKCECLSGYVVDGSGKCTELSVAIFPELRQKKKLSNGYTLEFDCKKSLQMYSNQDITQVLDLRIQSGLTNFDKKVTKIEGTKVLVDMYPHVTMKGEVVILNLKDSTFMSLNNLSSKDYQTDLTFYVELTDWQKEANDTTGSVAEVTVVAILTTIIPIAIFSNFYVLINTIDLTAFLYYLLFIEVRYPSNVLTFYGFFQNFQFPFIPDLFLNIISQDYVQEAAQPFMDNATQRYFLSNSGQSISIVIYILAIYVVGKLFSYVSIPKVQNYLKRAMYETWEYSAFYDLVWSLYIYFLIGALLQFQTYDFEEDNHVVNYILHSITSVIMILAPFWVIYLLYKEKELKSDCEFKVKYSTLIGGLVLFDEPTKDSGSQENEESADEPIPEKSEEPAEQEGEGGSSEQPVSERQLRWQIQFTKLYMGILYLRKLLFSFILVFMTDFPYTQLGLFSAMNVVMLVYFLYIKPLTEKWENIKNAVGEVVLIIVQICAAILVDDEKEDDEDRRYNIGWVIIAFSGFIMAWHTIQLIYEMVTSFYKWLRSLCKKDDSKKVHVFNQDDDLLNQSESQGQMDQSMSQESQQPSYVESQMRLGDNSFKSSPQRKKQATRLFQKRPSSNASSNKSDNTQF